MQQQEIRSFKSYQEMKSTHEKELNQLNMGFAFSDKQFDEMMEEWGLDPEKDLDKIVRLNVSGGFLQKKDLPEYRAFWDRYDAENKLFKKQQKNLVEMLVSELANHEYCITGDLEETLNACGFDKKDYLENESLRKAVKKAKSEYLSQCNSY